PGWRRGRVTARERAPRVGTTIYSPHPTCTSSSGGWCGPLARCGATAWRCPAPTLSRPPASRRPWPPCAGARWRWRGSAPAEGAAARAVVREGDDLRLRLINRRLGVGDRLGRGPDRTPSVQIARDVAARQRRLRLPPEVGSRDVDLDLRRDIDLDRSRLLHRL